MDVFVRVLVHVCASIYSYHHACTCVRTCTYTCTHTHRSGPRLTQDLGFDFLPEIKGYYTDSPMAVLQFVLFGACILSLVPRQTPTPYAVNIVRRWGMMIAMGNTLRFLTYISTTLPGAADHCLPSNPNIEIDQPKTVYDIFFKLVVDGSGTGESGTYNCGDLTFSGHQLMTMTYAFCCLRYVPQAYSMSLMVEQGFAILVWALVVIQVISMYVNDLCSRCASMVMQVMCMCVHIYV